MLKNAWYMAAWSVEVARGTLLARTLVGNEVVLFRDPMGQAHILRDMCPHRFAPLSLGLVTPEGSIRCRYHGLEFDGSGKCTKNPHGDGRIPAGAHTKCFAVAEKYGIIWFWPGDTALANEAAIPDFAAIDESNCFVARRYLPVKANYVLETDNIMDLSHIQYLHPTTLGSGSVNEGVTEVIQNGQTVHSLRTVRGEKLTPFLHANFQVPEGSLADRWLDVRWDAPSCMLLTVTIAATGQPQTAGNTILLPHIFTPETESTTHYWYASCFPRSQYPDGQERADRHVEGLTKPFATEDLPMLEAQQRTIGNRDFWQLRPVLLPGDAAAVRARRLLDARIAAERQAQTK